MTARPLADAAVPTPRLAPAAAGDRPALGILLVLVSTVFLSGSDAISKLLSASLPPLEVAWLRWAAFTAIMAGALAAGPRREGLATNRPVLQVVRGVGLVGSAILFITGLRFLPVAEATAISFVSPVFVTALSIPILGERIGVRRWAAALVGLVGILVIVRPGTSAFQAAALLPMLSSLFWAVGLVVTRKIGRADTSRTTMTISALVGFVLLTVLVPAVWITPRLEHIALGVLIGAAATTGHWIVTAAYRYAPASLLVPFSYAQILWATLLGYLFFGNVPDGWTYVGAGIVIASGLYTAHRERVRAREAVLARAAARAPGARLTRRDGPRRRRGLRRPAPRRRVRRKAAGAGRRGSPAPRCTPPGARRRAAPPSRRPPR
jgi:drug/metabolite transporter (DMT)-like permease